MKKLFSWVCRKLYKIELTGKENKETLKSHLKNGSVIVAFNHFCLDDVVLLLVIFLVEAGEEIKEMVIPGSRRYWGNPILGLIMRSALLIGLRVYPVVQHYERTLYPPAYTFSLDRQFVEVAKLVLARKGRVLFLAPEGHRSEDGRLQSPQKGVEFLLRLVERQNFNTVLIPVGIEPQVGFSRWVNFGRRFIIHFGHSLTAERIKKLALELKISPAWVIMQEIAALLPARLTKR